MLSAQRPIGHDGPAWLEGAGAPEIEGNSGPRFANAALAIHAAIDALGVMVAQHPFVEDDLRTGCLVAPFSAVARTRDAYYLACHPHRPKSARLAALEDWLLGEARVVRDG